MAQPRSVAVVTGGTSGIAYAVATQLVKTHDLVLNFPRDVEGAEQAKVKLEGMVPGQEVVVKLVQGNIAEESTVNTIFETVDALGRGIATLVHSAGTGVPGKKQKLGDGTLFAAKESETAGDAIDFSDYDYYQDVYPKAFTRMIERAIARQPEQSGGAGAQKKLSVVAVSSPGCNSTQNVPKNDTYDLRGPAKATLETLVRYYARRLAGRGITVNAVIPGVVITKAWANIAPPGVDTKVIIDKVTQSIPMQREAQPEEIAAAVAFLCSDGAKYITGVALPVDGGFHLGPAM